MRGGRPLYSCRLSCLAWVPSAWEVLVNQQSEGTQSRHVCAVSRECIGQVIAVSRRKYMFNLIFCEYLLFLD